MEKHAKTLADIISDIIENMDESIDEERFLEHLQSVKVFFGEDNKKHC